VKNSLSWKKVFACFLAVTFLLSSTAFAEEKTMQNACHAKGTAFGFFNGVQTSREYATDSLKKLQHRFGTKDQKGEQIRYELFYNQSKGLEDFVETFEQRLNEHKEILGGRFELFLEAALGGDTLWKKVVEFFPNLSSELTSKFFHMPVFKVPKV
jgi:hypothetical protein